MLVQSPSPGIRLHSMVTLSMLQFSFNSVLFVIRLAYTDSPPLGVLTISIRAYAPDIWFSHLGVRSWLANLDLLLHSYSFTHTHGLPCPSHV